MPRDLLAFLGGFDEACEPRHLPWRHAHDIVNYLALNFFDATLNGDAEALARLDPRSSRGSRISSIRRSEDLNSGALSSSSGIRQKKEVFTTG